MLLADDYEKTRVSLGKPLHRLVIVEGRANENDIIENAAEWAAELVHEELRLARVGRPHDESIERYVGGVHFSTAQILTFGLKR